MNDTLPPEPPITEMESKALFDWTISRQNTANIHDQSLTAQIEQLERQLQALKSQIQPNP